MSQGVNCNHHEHRWSTLTCELVHLLPEHLVVPSHHRLVAFAAESAHNGLDVVATEANQRAQVSEVVTTIPLGKTLHKAKKE